jgi:hypothetical protein
MKFHFVSITGAFSYRKQVQRKALILDSTYDFNLDSELQMTRKGEYVDE